MGTAATMQAARTQRTRVLVTAGGVALLLLGVARFSGHGPAWLQGDTLFKSYTGDPELQDTFEDVYKRGKWGSDGGGSGAGSTVEITKGTRALLKQAITDLGVRSMIDVPCGAMVWMPLLLEEVEKEQPSFKYLGLDITASVVKKNKKTFATKKNWRFGAFDLTSQALPRGYDLIHTRDALQHLSCRSIVAALRTLATSSSRYLLVGSYNATTNVDIEDGEYFDLNLRRPPYNLDKPLAVFAENNPQFAPKFQLLYSIPELAKQDFAAMKLRCAFPQACPDCP
ncbi:glycosyl transferase [Micractinium conductrix]|uniref:Glycosyl transferase n=1 Tax=Micractinium conductrix TaxID=554055 RepID=A0A2P6VHF8_9CHLO|nr:glycosyl transferase [Micractinium conductrix]|eukprot:PSC73524.1 glycosyl transferase [Micractinium conductrix]